MRTEFRDTIEKKYQKGNQLLFSKDSSCLGDLISMMENQTHKTLILWAFDCAKQPLRRLEVILPGELRPRIALELSEAWARGQIKMAVAKRGILDAHAVAKEIENKEGIALCHAIGHAGATVHVKTHAPGLAFYELTALVHQVGLEQCEALIQNQIVEYIRRLQYWREQTDQAGDIWAKFLSEKE